MARFMLALALCAALSGCKFFEAVGAWAAKQDVQVCVEYKGRHFCAGRQDGQWTFSANDGNPVTPDDEAGLLDLLK